MRYEGRLPGRCVLAFIVVAVAGCDGLPNSRPGEEDEAGNTASAALAAPTPPLLLDLNTQPPTASDLQPGSPTSLTAIGNTVFFAGTGHGGTELWKSDGTPEGTVLVKDIASGPGSASPQHLTAVGNTVYFVAGEVGTGVELWKSNGTPAGTVLVKDILPGSTSSSPSNLTALGSNLVLFVVSEGFSRSLWRSDGTEAGTYRLQAATRDWNPSELTAVPALGLVFFRSTDSATGTELWRSDGTVSGTFLVQDLASGTASTTPQRLIAVGDTLFFRANATNIGQEYWKSRGGRGDITLVKDVTPGFEGSTVQEQVALGGVLYFSRINGTSYELWRSDGTDAGTRTVTAAWVSSDCGLLSLRAAPLQRRLYFGVSSGSDVGCELWTSDGTAAGTAMLKDIQPGPRGSSPALMVEAGGLVYFLADDTQAGTELWKSDGTRNGTVRVKDIVPGLGSPYAQYLTAAGSRLFFQAQAGAATTQLWRSDGTDAGTLRLSNPLRLNASSAPASLVEWQGTLYFRATDGLAGQELWRSDGTTTGTRRVRDIRPGSGDSGLAVMVKAEGQLFFTASDGVTGSEPWRSDGTEEGTRMVRDVNPGSAGPLVLKMLPVGNTVYFDGYNGTYGRELWKSDGTEDGTRMVRDIGPGVSQASLSSYSTAAVDGEVYFTANDGTHGLELWRTDGSEAGTRMVRDINPGAPGSTPSMVTRANGLLFFTASDGTHGTELWRTDGTEAGTELVVDLTPGSNSSVLESLTAWNGALYFTRAQGAELWRTDGTASGTVRLLNTGYSYTASSNAPVVPMGGHLYFTAADVTHGLELWRTDGTVAGTARVADISPGPTGSRPLHLVAAGERLYFAASDGVHGHELWMTDGTAAGTVLVADVAPGAWSSSPENLTVVRNRLYFSADDLTSGVELWSIPLATSADTTPPVVTCPANVTAEATSASGAAVEYPLAVATDDVSTNVTLSYSHPRGSTFAMGTTQVTATATDEAGNVASCTFSVTVHDTTPPQLVCHADITAEVVTAQSAPVEYPPANVSDAVTPAQALAVLYSPLSGYRFPLGTTPVSMRVQDEVGNESSCTFNVTVVPGTIDLSCHATWEEANSPEGNIIHLNENYVSRTDGLPHPLTVTFDPPSGSRFPIGTTTVRADVVDSQLATGTCTFNLEVRDTTPPVLLDCGDYTSVEATSSAGAVVNVREPTWYDVASHSLTFSHSHPPDFTYPLGLTFHTITAMDAASNSATCTAWVIVQDTTPPAVTCGPDVTVEATGPDGASVTYAAPTATDAVTASPTLSASHASGSVFPVGTTGVTITARDGANNTDTCAFNVTVVEPPPPPVITCPTDVTAEATSANGATVTFPAATATGSREPVTVTYSHESGAVFPLDATTVTATARDADGRTASCEFTVTVHDTTPPSLTCPANMTVTATGGGSAEVLYTPAEASDTVSFASIFYSPLSGSRFSLGTSTVNVSATDVAGNTATCSFTVTVVPRPLALTCPNDEVIEATSPNGAVVDYGPALVTDGVGPYEVTYSQATGTGFPLGTTTVTVNALDSAGSGASCTFSVTVRDTTAPVLTCESFFPVEATSSAGAVANVPEPTWTDAASTTVEFTYSPPPGHTFPLGGTPRTVTAKDAAGNVSDACTTFVVVQDTTPPAVTCGPDVTVEATGPNGASVTYAAPTATDAVTASPTLSASHASGSVFPLGTTRVTVTAKDGANNTGTCAFNVTVVEPPPPPAITCPADATAEATSTEGATITFPAATVTGGRSPVAVTYSHESGIVFARGTTTVTATARDADGRTVTCTFSVTVSDTTAPALTCPASVDTEATSGAGAAVDFPLAVATDAGSASVVPTYSHAPGSTFPLGTTEVVATATDAAGNTVNCGFTVTVRDTTAPVLTCPADVSVVTPHKKGTDVAYPAPTAGDAVSAPVVTATPASGSEFPVGTTPVVVTATDAAGNSATCTFQVTVSTRKPVTVEEPDELEVLGCSAGAGTSAGFGWGALLLLGLVRRRGTKRS
ncbi:HYR domain-containing protein [Pyxidicoccus fallax]|uniref:HYR domain-containing protein n=1 Tax=Pyxidicoccus fallax TaxID=394095 RepID=A0A848LTT5_9BACT|nr:ELWxxDGT repeat protein [Pyxidicoccus fallax]NMO21089.1 HYR domain-containing protein [Pyxidicoccus fallax]NPC82524.1 HYR domain-containing protein [Pyxidicoccus fallax]